MNLPTISDVTRTFLYDSVTIPNKLSDSLIRQLDDQAEVPINVDLQEYMTVGPGRFALPPSLT